MIPNWAIKIFKDRSRTIHMTKNPGVFTLRSFLRAVKRLQPATARRISASLNRAYGMATRYIKFSLRNSLIEIHEVGDRHHHRRQKLYVLTEKGVELLNALEKLWSDRS